MIQTTKKKIMELLKTHKAESFSHNCGAYKSFRHQIGAFPITLSLIHKSLFSTQTFTYVYISPTNRSFDFGNLYTNQTRETKQRK